MCDSVRLLFSSSRPDWCTHVGLLCARPGKPIFSAISQAPRRPARVGATEYVLLWLELRRLPPNSAPDSGVIFHAAAGVGPPRTDIRKSEEKLHLKDSHQTRTGRAQRGPWYALLSLQTRLLAVFYALGTG